MRYALSQLLARLCEKHQIHLEAIDPESMLTPFLLTLTKTSSILEAELQIKQRETTAWFFSQIIPGMPHSKQAALLKQCLTCLQQRQIAGMQKETLETFAGFSKN
jgi:hypothetical protein